MKNDPKRLARILVLYHSEGGNTKLMAELVAAGAGGVPDTEVRMKTVAEATAEDLVWCDGIAVGSPTHMGTISWEMKRWWDVVAQPLWPEVEGKLGSARLLHVVRRGRWRRRVDVRGDADCADELRPAGFWRAGLCGTGPDTALRRDLRGASAS